MSNNSPVTKTHVKICGMTNLEDCLVAAEAGADLLGFIFYPPSPRRATPEDAATIIPILQQEFSHVKTVGVFVNESVAHIKSVQQETGFDYVQLHGEEPIEFFPHFGGMAYKVLRPSSKDEAIADAATYAPLGPADGPTWLIDAYDPNLYGGTGHKTDWETAAQLAQQYPGLLLAGGLTPDNVTQAIQAVKPWGIDLASGVEATKGKKDHAKMRDLLETVQQLNQLR